MDNNCFSLGLQFKKLTKKFEQGWIRVGQSFIIIVLYI